MLIFGDTFGSTMVVRGALHSSGINNSYDGEGEKLTRLVVQYLLVERRKKRDPDDGEVRGNNIIRSYQKLYILGCKYCT